GHVIARHVIADLVPARAPVAGEVVDGVDVRLGLHQPVAHRRRALHGLVEEHGHQVDAGVGGDQVGLAVLVHVDGDDVGGRAVGGGHRAGGEHGGVAAA